MQFSTSVSMSTCVMDGKIFNAVETMLATDGSQTSKTRIELDRSDRWGDKTWINGEKCLQSNSFTSRVRTWDQQVAGKTVIWHGLVVKFQGSTAEMWVCTSVCVLRCVSWTAGFAEIYSAWSSASTLASSRTTWYNLQFALLILCGFFPCEILRSQHLPGFRQFPCQMVQPLSSPEANMGQAGPLQGYPVVQLPRGFIDPGEENRQIDVQQDLTELLSLAEIIRECWTSGPQFFFEVALWGSRFEV